MDVKKIVLEYLETKGYDGLFAAWNCACKKSDLMPCMGDGLGCEPGYESPCDCGNEHDFHIGPHKLANLTGGTILPEPHETAADANQEKVGHPGIRKPEPTLGRQRLQELVQGLVQAALMEFRQQHPEPSALNIGDYIILEEISDQISPPESHETDADGGRGVAEHQGMGISDQTLDRLRNRIEQRKARHAQIGQGLRAPWPVPTAFDAGKEPLDGECLHPGLLAPHPMPADICGKDGEGQQHGNGEVQT